MIDSDLVLPEHRHIRRRPRAARTPPPPPPPPRLLLLQRIIHPRPSLQPLPKKVKKKEKRKRETTNSSILRPQQSSRSAAAAAAAAQISSNKIYLPTPENLRVRTINHRPSLTRTSKSPRSMAPAAAVICSNADLLMEIILLLPIKSLIRFQFVHKRWQSLILSPYFSQLHHQRHLHKSQHYFLLVSQRAHDRLCFYFNPTGKLLFPHCFDSNYMTPQIMQSSNGLLLLGCRKSPHSPMDFYVYNPTTRQSRLLLFDPQRSVGLTLAFDPSRSPHYKVLCVYFRESCRGQHRYQVDVYDSESHTWKVLVETFTLKRMYDFPCGVFWKNRIYWDYNETYLDVEKGSIGRMFPSIGSGLCQHIIQWNGSVFCVHHRDRSLVVGQLLGSDRPCWSKKYRADPKATYRRIEVLGVMIGEHEEDFSTVFHVPGKICYYKYADGSFGVLMDLTTHKGFQEGGFQFTARNAYQVTESLTPV